MSGDSNWVAPWLLPDGTLPTAEGGARVLLVLGKGGVGRTTTTALLAHGAHAAGLKVLVAVIDGKSSLHRLCPNRVDVRSVSAGSALEDYLLDQGFGAFARRLAQSGVIEVVGAAAPGIHDLVVLGKVKQFANAGQHDLVIVDAPATGHATSMLSSVAGLLEIVEGGPIREQALDVNRLLLDADRCAAVVVTKAETTPVNESIELISAVRNIGVELASGVVNAVEPDGDLISLSSQEMKTLPDSLAESVHVAIARHRRSLNDMERFAEALHGSVVSVPRLPTAELREGDIATLAGHISGDSDS
jgi:arsenite/tail-anchored protein-transporting ATPase